MENRIYDTPEEQTTEETALTETVQKDKVLSFEEYLKSKVQTEEDFEGDAIYKGLYLINNEFRRKLADGKFERKAFEIGGAKLRNRYRDLRDSYFRQKKKEEKEQKLLRKKMYEQYKGIIDGMTNYSNLPEGVNNLDCGPLWTADDGGIYCPSNKAMPIACSHPVLIKAIWKSMDTGEEKVELLFCKNGKWEKVLVDKDTLASTQKILNLHKYGISVTTVNAKMLVAFLQNLEDYSLRKNLIPYIWTTEHFGWNEAKDAFFPFTNQEIRYDSQGKLPGLSKALEEKGNAEEWKEKICMLRQKDIKMLKFVLAANFSAVLVGMTKSEGFVCNLYGPSRGGKSVTNKIGCSIWAGFREKDGIMFSAENTTNAMEGMLAALNNIPLLLEDANNMDERKQREMQTLIMKICNGVGKGRMRKDLSLREVARWNTVGIITSENRIIKDCNNTGSVNRVLMLRGTNEKECPYNQDGLNASELLGFFEENHGFAGKAFALAVAEMGEEKIRERLQKIREEVSEKIKGTNKSAGQIEPVSFMLLADEIAEKHIFQDGKRISMEEAISWMADESTANQNERFYENLMDTVIQNSGRFEGLGLTEDMNIQQYWGRYFKGKEQVAILPKILKNLADEANLDVKLFLEYLDEKGLIEKDKSGNYTKNVNSKMLGKGSRMYVIKMPEIKKEPDEEEFEYMDKSDEEIPFE